MEPPEPRQTHIFSAILKTAALIFVLPMLVPGLLIGWSMVVQAVLERAGYAVPTYSRDAICFTLEDLAQGEQTDVSAELVPYGRIPIQDCRHMDALTDDGDGPDEGQIQWQVCWGIDCGENLEPRVPTPAEPWRLSRIAILIGGVLFLGLMVVLPIGVVIQLMRAVFSVDVRRHVRSRLFRYVLGLILAGVIVFPFFGVQRIQKPSDDDLLTHFSAHETVFTELIEMLREDTSLQYISQSMVSPPSDEAYRMAARYRELLEEAGLICINSSWEDNQTIKFQRLDTYANAKFAKGYVYAASAPASLRTSLDGGYGDLPAQSRAFKRMTGNWYIYIENQSYP